MVALNFLALVAVSCSAFVAALPTAQQFDYPYGQGRGDVAVVGSTLKHVNRTHDTFSVQIAVRNKAFEKQVGIKWTQEAWSSSEEVPAHYVGGLDSGFELWEVTDVGPFDSTKYPMEFWDPAFTAYASFANGPRVWDLYPNYNVLIKATQDNPMIILPEYSSGLHYDIGQKKYVLSVALRTLAFDLNADTQLDKLKVRWSIDDWKTYKDTPAVRYDANGHTFWVDAVVGDASTKYPTTLSYAFLYTHSKGTFWVNNLGKNFDTVFPSEVPHWPGEQ
ncbi:uncharacterized protein EV422DRAFT_564719 [Fimicolochytrium jonesii]|uniref:uncharacterized protein n=1 Tax=Fimicolochytrium jonesii TaxID=1396493 RepID=UPI0022FEA12F|nr:uncharacterized protein EV422DRAFT_564719 [Fimicolochytrium jonesii]KAI8824012.1 hypothetical protein EV422DRAFT_564719 [Fimicolochytrium jonesii]